MAEGAISRRRLAGYAAGAAATGAVAVAATPTMAGAVVPPMWFDIKDYGAVGNGVANDTAAIQAAVTAAAAATTGAHNHGAVVYAPAGVYKIDAAIVFPNFKAVDLVGCGRWQTRFLCTTAAAKLQFGTANGRNGASTGQTGGFWVDGNNVATTAMIVSTCSNRSFFDIQIGKAGVGLRVDGVQNAVFEGLWIHECTSTGLVLDWGAGGNTFVGAQLRDNAKDLLFQNSWNGTDTDPADASWPQYGGRPSDNKFVGGIIESPAAAVSVDHSAGVENYFIGVRFACKGITIDFRHQNIGFAGGLKGSFDMYLIGCFFVGGTVTGTKVGKALKHTCPFTHVWVTNCKFQTMETALTLGDGCWVDLDRFHGVDITNRFAKAVVGQAEGEETLVRREVLHTQNITRPNAADVALRTWVGTDIGASRQNHPQLLARASGELGWGPGTAAADVTLKRSAAGILQSNGKVTAVGGLGVGNSANATTLGAVVKRIQVFDANGTSLGYVPVYNNIT